MPSQTMRLQNTNNTDTHLDEDLFSHLLNEKEGVGSSGKKRAGTISRKNYAVARIGARTLDDNDVLT